MDYFLYFQMYKASILNPIALIMAVVPCLLLLWFFYKRDYFPEPKKVLWVTFALGVLIIIPALVIGFPIRMYISTTLYPCDTFLYCFILAFGVAGFIEEMLKFCVIRFYAYRNKAFDEPIDGIVYGVAASLGFATLENVMYVSSYGIYNALLRAVTAVPVHALLGAIMGYYIGQYRFKGKSFTMLLKALVIPIFLHGLYDFILFLGYIHYEGTAKSIVITYLATGILLISMITWVLIIIARLRKKQNPLNGIINNVFKFKNVVRSLN